jgi:ABC-type Fe3+-citrate transport system substrate-binding protein
MDISTTKVKIDKDKDLLAQMFEKQAEVEKDFARVEGFPERMIFGKLENLHHPEICRHINDNILWRMVQEINEAVVALKNAKTWRQSKYMTDVNEYLDEVADIQIYFINLCLASGIDPKLLTETVLKKIQVNHDRIRSKY